jgi:predicted enzyme related to lactoylglutathione lyase
MITSIAYSSHQVKDLNRAQQFYEGLLGLKLVSSYADRWQEYDIHGETFALYKPMEDTPEYFRKNKITASIAFEVSNMDTLFRKLKKTGVSFLQEPENNGHCIMAYLKDPDGNIVTLHQLLEKE